EGPVREGIPLSAGRFGLPLDVAVRIHHGEAIACVDVAQLGSGGVLQVLGRASLKRVDEVVQVEAGGQVRTQQVFDSLLVGGENVVVVGRVHHEGQTCVLCPGHLLASLEQRNRF